MIPRQHKFVSARVEAELAREFEEVARASERTVSAELRKLMRERVALEQSPTTAVLEEAA